MLNQILENIKAALESDPSNPPAELFFKDISQYKYISQNPVSIINFRGAEFEKPPHPSLSGQKGVLDVSFFYFSRTIEDTCSERILGFLDAVRALENVEVQAFKPYSHRKNTSIWEVKTQIVKMI